jgi:hypothetical protein
MEQEYESLPPYCVHVVEAPTRAMRGVIQCEIGQGQNLSFSSEGLESYCFMPQESIIFDALLLAAAVEFCDRSLRRPSWTWGRNIILRLPVHDSGSWKAAAVTNTVTEALNFLTGDLWTLDFRERKRKEPLRHQRPLNLPLNANAVMPFSDGLDSWCVGTLFECNRDAELVRVRVLSRKVGRRPSDREQPFASIPYDVRTRTNNQPGSSGRHRGFKFALISGIAAYLAKVDTIMMPESGQGALGPALVPVGRAYTDYRTHPLFTAKMERFLTALFGCRIHYDFPRLRNTKGETLRDAVAVSADSEVWKKTRSCWQHNGRVSVDGKRRQCGVCAACMLRRLSVHAAGFEEASQTYVWENLRSPSFAAGAALGFSKSPNPYREYAVAGTLHMDHLAAVITSDLHQTALRRNAFQISQGLGESVDSVEVKLRHLLETHRNEWRNFMNSLGVDSFVRPWTQAAT